jgi:glycosyltransferase involved in cell wall biosynthesis
MIARIKLFGVCKMPKISIITVTRSRPQLLVKAIASLEAQTSQDFEWIVINDGEEVATREAIANSHINFSHTYLDMVHPDNGFALSYGRNRGVVMAQGDIVTYLDDDNAFKPNFVAETIAFFDRHPQVNYSMPIQQRRRDILQDGMVVKRGEEFLSPTPNCTVEELISHQQLIDSNGFAHRNTKDLSLTWNLELKIYIDYEFLLKCVCHWGRESFGINRSVLVDYIQTNQGIIGRSNYQDWTKELKWIIDRRELYPCLEENNILTLVLLKEKYSYRHQKFDRIAAFSDYS